MLGVITSGLHTDNGCPMGVPGQGIPKLAAAGKMRGGEMDSVGDVVVAILGCEPGCDAVVIVNRCGWRVGGKVIGCDKHTIGPPVQTTIVIF